MFQGASPTVGDALQRKPEAANKSSALNDSYWERIPVPVILLEGMVKKAAVLSSSSVLPMDVSRIKSRVPASVLGKPTVRNHRQAEGCLLPSLQPTHKEPSSWPGQECSTVLVFHAWALDLLEIPGGSCEGNVVLSVPVFSWNPWMCLWNMP